MPHLGEILAGLVAVTIGLVFFTEGLQYGLMPIGELVGHQLPRAISGFLLILIAVILGTVITLAEPSIGVLRVLASSELIEAKRAPILWALLNGWPLSLSIAVGLGAGLAAGMGLLRIQYAWPLRPMLYFTCAITFAVAFAVQNFSATTGDAEGLIGIAWDLGAVTAGPITVPLILALGAGTSRAERVGEEGGEGFGIVALASLFPVLMVLCLTLYFELMVPEGQILAMSHRPNTMEHNFHSTLWAAFKSLVPLAVLLRVLLYVAGRSSVPEAVHS